ncbi:hypothetical protein ACLEIY_01260 [Acetobacter tropicalis]|uniref:Uncharacterized protein n=1 Tax=Acetobacter tropicalis TaxID=104102 RepID=A0A149TT67_9PROT|nr:MULTISPECIES: hypothetical protein [Acetobacter]KXV56405.1 hypothetical protein AD947_10530 [Acetobacter tropicalis]MCP1195070.1 hypothetical protein [Acetobacter senegalensis]
MDISVIDQILSENIELFDRASTAIRQCLQAYEKKCSELIAEIATFDSVSAAEHNFDSLFDIQGQLATLLFKYRFDIGPKLETLTREFDRLYDPYIRNYWFEKFKGGVRWPE